MKFKRNFFLVLCFCLITQVAFAAIPTIAVEELRPGMTGYGKTVIEGAKIETFDVEILGVTGSDTMGHSILIKASGPLLQKSGGIAQGMSGSPVYIDGRLAGAVAYGKAFSDPNYCFLTPINEMLRLFDNPDPRPSVFLPKNTPLMVSGFNSAGVAYLNEQLAPFNLNAYGAPAGQGDFSYVQLEPGSSIGVELVKGDITLGAIGTVTWTDDEGRILAFGHPFLQRGASDYFMTNAWIFASVPNMQSAFKVGSLGNVVGNITQDRSAGIAGKIGGNSRIIPVYVSVTDKNTGEHKSSSVQVITDENLAPALIDSVCYNTIAGAADRRGGGTSRLSFTISARGDKQGEIHLTRDNMFSSTTDIAKATDGELQYACKMLLNNRFDNVTIFDVNIDAEISSDYDVAEIVSASTKKSTIAPGEDLPIDITFKPYRSKNVTKTIKFKIPDKQPVGPLNLIVRSGNSVGWLKTALTNMKTKEKEPQQEQLLTQKKTFKNFIDEFNEADSNNAIVVDIMEGLPQKKNAAEATAVNQPETFAQGLRSLLKGSKFKQKYPMEFISTGEANLKVNVTAKK
jgi:hypothetical protein